jgi:hypothetical protein
LFLRLKVEDGAEWSIKFLGERFMLGGFSDFWLTMVLDLLAYVILFGVYVALLHAKGRSYDRKSVIPILILLPLALVVGGIAKSQLL